jgi:enamine deaminase RidA (YjgF/YER057c/UK114 family)
MQAATAPLRGDGGVTVRRHDSDLQWVQNSPSDSSAGRGARQCLKNVSAILDAAGGSIDNIVSASVVARDPEDFAVHERGMAGVVSDESPARQGAKLPFDVVGLRVSIAVVATA